MRRLVPLCVVLLFACTTQGEQGPAGATGAPGTPGQAGQSVTTTTLDQGDAHCPNGGVSVTSGSGTSYVCNGSAGAGVTVNALSVGNGACPTGGVEVISGATSTVACNGAAGAPGSGVTSAALSAGQDAHCPNGGSSFTTASGTTYACNGSSGSSSSTPVSVMVPLTGDGASVPLGLNVAQGLKLATPNVVVDFPPADPWAGYSLQPARSDHVHKPELVLPLADFTKATTPVTVGPVNVGAATFGGFALTTSSVSTSFTIPAGVPLDTAANLVLSVAGNANGVTINTLSTGVKYGFGVNSMCGDAPASVSVITNQVAQVTIPLSTTVCTASTPGDTGPGDLVAITVNASGGTGTISLVGARVVY